MRSILVHAEAGPAGRARIDTALSLARMTRGHLTLLVDTPVSRYVAVDGLGGGFVATDALKDAIAGDDAFAREIDSHLARGDVRCDVVRAERDPIDALADSARLADLVVVARREALASDLPLAVRCPVLAVNAEETLTFPLTRVAVAWDGSVEAATALRSAVSLLGDAEVSVITVENASADFPATDAVAYLSRHGIKAELKVVERVGAVQETIARELGLLQPQLLVMGAFRHSRLREFLFGGVTRFFLDEPAGPALLLAH
ncbi:universal stress protein [Novosphingobium bradum]|uniref:Universal stress protein n=1 Tax=Novosphingobium bradum TaxID=1737444 RepID=A0ABV7IMS1_9SPHN